MEARNICLRIALILAVLLPVGTAHSTEGLGNRMAGNLRTRNFVVTAPSQELASQIGFAAEKYRRDLAMEWLGKELPDWPEPCVITAYIKPQAFGETSFSFAGQRGRPSRPFDFVMKVNGSEERILDSVLPHEVSHTIFATYFGQPLPRWADEGACTTVEHLSERRKNHRMLIEFLTTGRGIPFNRMFAMKNYPRDILPLYAQGYSLCRFLIQRGGKRKFIQFMTEGVNGTDWGTAVKRHYKIENLSQLQLEWLKWVKAGCPLPESETLVKTESSPQASDTVSPPSQSINTQNAFNNHAQPVSTQAMNVQPMDRQTTSQSSENFYLKEIARVKASKVRR